MAVEAAISELAQTSTHSSVVFHELFQIIRKRHKLRTLHSIQTNRVRNSSFHQENNVLKPKRRHLQYQLHSFSLQAVGELLLGVLVNRHVADVNKNTPLGESDIDACWNTSRLDNKNVLQETRSLSKKNLKYHVRTNMLPTKEKQCSHQHESDTSMQVTQIANVAPGWRRVVTNDDVFYVSPTGTVLLTHGQIKEYLLSPTTCKCGLPCPLRPDKFFNFNCQVPNRLWQIASQCDSKKGKLLLCTHEKKNFDCQENFRKGITQDLKEETDRLCLQTAEQSRHLVATHIEGGSTDEPKAKDQCFSHQKHQFKPVRSDCTQLGHAEYDKKNFPSKPSPWRKNKGLKEQSSSCRGLQMNTVKAFSSESSNVISNERVPPLPLAHTCPSPCEKLQAMEEGNLWPDSAQHLLAKSEINTGVVVNKKKLNFREDPAGYLDHQTAMLQGSILNAHSATVNDLSRNWGFTDILEKENAVQTDFVLEKCDSELKLIENKLQPTYTASTKGGLNLFSSNTTEIKQEEVGIKTDQLFHKALVHTNTPSGPFLNSSNSTTISNPGHSSDMRCNGFFIRTTAPFTAKADNQSANIETKIAQRENCELNFDTTPKHQLGLTGEQVPSTSGQQRLYCMSTLTTIGECHQEPIPTLCHPSSKMEIYRKNNNSCGHNVCNNNMNKNNKLSINKANSASSADRINIIDQKNLSDNTDSEDNYNTCIDNTSSSSHTSGNIKQKNGEDNKVNCSNPVGHRNVVSTPVNSCSSQQLMGLVSSQQLVPHQQVIQTIKSQANSTIEQQLGDFVNFSQTNSTIKPSTTPQIDQSCDYLSTHKPQKQPQHFETKPHTCKQGVIATLTAVVPLSSEYDQKSNIKNLSETSVVSNHLVSQQFQFNQAQPILVGPSQESPVSSSTTFNKSTPEDFHFYENKGPAQVRAISTSNENSMNCSSSASFCDLSLSSVKATSLSVTTSNTNLQIKQQKSLSATSSTSARNTITSVTAGKALTATTSIGEKIPSLKTIETNNIHQQHYIHVQQSLTHNPVQQQRSPPPCFQVQKSSKNTSVPGSTNFSALQLQSVVREPGNQLIMTSTGQLIVMPTQPNKSPSQVIINNANANNIVMNNQQSVVINQQSAVVNNSHLIGNSVDVISNQSNTTNIIQSPGSSLVIQNSGIVQTGQNIIHSPSNIITNNNTNFIVNSTSSIQPMILNNSNIIQQSGQNLINTNAANMLQAATNSDILNATNGSKVISSSGSILNNQNIMTNQSSVINNQVLSNTSNIISPSIGQAFVFNAIPNGYVIQPNFTTVDGQVMGQIVNQDNSTTILQQQQKQIILTSPDSKRKTKKRKSSFSSPSTPCNLSPQQSPSIQQQASSITQATTQSQGTVVQLTPQYPTQGYHIGPAGIQGITVLNKNAQTQPQILFQNGQLIQPLNLIGQQLIVPAGLVVAPETTLLQIQNVTPCGSILTPPSMVVRANSQNKNFLSSSTAGQQFLVGGNGQLSPIGQIYGTPVGLVIPPSNTGAATYVQQNTTIVQQQTTMMSNTDNTVSERRMSQVSVSPPDTTTNSPRSPERPPSRRSTESDMVQCVSSSEPDSLVLPESTDRTQSPTSTDNDRYYSYQFGNNFKPSNVKIRRLENSSLFKSHPVTEEINNQIRPDSHDSSSTNPASSTTTSGASLCHSGVCGVQVSSFCIGELVWGAARGHPAWPGKIVSPPDGICKPSDSTWVQWFGGRSNFELVAIRSLKSLSEGLDAHHKAQQDARKSRKLNSQLERAIQEAMTELDRTSSRNITTNLRSNSKNRGRHLMTGGQQRHKPVKIAPAPSNGNIVQMRQKSNHINRRQKH